jgi:hypothetical protein
MSTVFYCQSGDRHYKFYLQLDRLCTFNVPYATTVAVEKQRVLHILSACLYVTLGIQYSMRMCHNVMYGLSGRTIFFHILILIYSYSMDHTVAELSHIK